MRDLTLMSKMKFTTQKSTIKKSLKDRLRIFEDKGIKTTLHYLATVTTFDEIGLDEKIFNRQFFYLCSLLSKNKRPLHIKTKNCSQFFILSIDGNECYLPPFSNGLALPVSRLTSPALSHHQIFDGQLFLECDDGGRSSIVLKIPLHPNEDLGSPLLQRAFFAFF